MTYRLYFFSVLLTVLCSTANGALLFNFDYSDASNGSLWTQDRKDSLRRAAAPVENLFTKYSATIDIQVKSEDNSASTTLASAGSNICPSAYTPGFATSDVVMNEILTGSDCNGGSFDGVVNVNWGSGYSTSATASGVPSNMFDFQSTMTHELLHAVGFLSSISQNGQDGFGKTAAGDWGPFDKHVANSAGFLIDRMSFDISAAAYSAAVVGGAGTGGLSFNGPNAMAANGGNPVYLYTPVAYEEGSSGSHLDDQFYNSKFMMEAATTQGPGIRDIGLVEQGILRDIGYTNLTAVPEPSGFLFLGLIATIRGFLSWRRQVVVTLDLDYR